MDTVFMNSENIKLSKPHVLVWKLSNKLDLRIGEKIIASSNLKIGLHLKLKMGIVLNF